VIARYGVEARIDFVFHRSDDQLKFICRDKWQSNVYWLCTERIKTLLAQTGQSVVHS
jgi:hypothetical protein